MAEGFFGRWSQRKLAERQGAPLQEPRPEPHAGAAGAAAPPAAQAAPAATGLPAGAADGDTAAQQRAPAPALTMQDVASLHKDSDFKPFIARAVQPEVRNAALRKLFSDPHFNVMDGLDTYIDDYSLPDPLPESMLRKMASAQFLRLFDDDRHDPQRADASGDEPGADVPREDADGTAAPVVAQSPAATDDDTGTVPHPLTGLDGPHDDDTDLRLQPDDAPGPARAGRGPE